MSFLNSLQTRKLQTPETSISSLVMIICIARSPKQSDPFCIKYKYLIKNFYIRHFISCFTSFQPQMDQHLDASHGQLPLSVEECTSSKRCNRNFYSNKIHNAVWFIPQIKYAYKCIVVVFGSSLYTHTLLFCGLVSKGM